MLNEIAGGLVMPYRDVVRARVILMVADGVSLSEIGRKVGLARRIVRKWAARLAVDRFRGPPMHQEAEGPRVFSPIVATHLVKLAC